MIFTSYDELKNYGDTLRTNPKPKYTVMVGMGTCGIASGAVEVMTLLQEYAATNPDIVVKKTGCIGLCYAEPVIEIFDEKGKSTVYGNLNARKTKQVIQSHFEKQTVLEYLKIDTDMTRVSMFEDQTIDTKQVRIALRNCGVIDPENIDDYITQCGYLALAKALNKLTPEKVVDNVIKSGLRGRGGGGFPTGVKWKYVASEKNENKNIICNADEGDPGAFMDRSVLEGDPHSVLEAMAVAGFACGAQNGYIYIRAEYPMAVDRLYTAIAQAKERNLLGDNIMGSGFNFNIHIKLGAGAFVCGEETALINSIEGQRGEPSMKPPYPAQSGLWRQPTGVNNVETYANVCPIILKGADWFTSIGSSKSKGTKVFALAGKIKHVGLVEVPMGITIEEMIFEVGGGIPKNKAFKAIQTGGPSGGVIPASLKHTRIDYDNLVELGSMMGSGGMIVMD